MIEVNPEILNSIPQRAPFLFVEGIEERELDRIVCTKHVTGKEDFFKGHFPGNPIMPGVLLQEAVFQTGALLMSSVGEHQGTGVVTKVENARFKGLVRPGDTLKIEVTLDDVVGNAYYMKGKIRVAGKVVMAISFTCALINTTLH